jgi:hypothetical protein
MTSWDRLSGHEAYRALALEHFSEFGERIREDLRTDFAEAAEAYYQHELEVWRRIESTPPVVENVQLLMPPMTSLFSNRKRDNVEKENLTPESMAQSDVMGRKADYLAAAMAGLARNGSPDDAEIGRRFLFHSEDDVRIEAIRIIRRFGNAKDVPNLIKIAKSSEGLLQELAANSALVVANDMREIADELLATGDEILVSSAVTELIARGDKKAIGDFLKEYLYNDNEKVRTRVMSFFVFRYDDKELESLLTQYTSEEVYYYDVVCCFDRVLYAPPRLASSYRKFVESIFFGLLVRDSGPTRD